MKTMDLKSKPAEIRRELGGAFSLFGGYITGRELELVPGRRIVQAWRVASWPVGIFSIVRFDLVGQADGSKPFGSGLLRQPEPSHQVPKPWIAAQRIVGRKPDGALEFGV